MINYVALFRGINVGGHHKLPMQELRDILASLGCQDVKTYIQSGNAVFRSAAQPDRLAADIQSAVELHAGFAPSVIIMTAERLSKIAAANPFPEAETTPTSLHVSLFREAPQNPDLEALARVKADSETFELGTDAFYLHAPEGIGRSRLAAVAEKALGVDTTGRNWRTVSKLLEMTCRSSS